MYGVELVRTLTCFGRPLVPSAGRRCWSIRLALAWIGAGSSGIFQLVGRIRWDVAERAPHTLERACVRIKDDHPPVDVTVGYKDLICFAIEEYVGRRIQVAFIVVP